MKNSELHINAQNYPEGCYEELEKLKKEYQSQYADIESKHKGSRQRAMEDAANAGSLAQFFHAKDTELKLTEAGKDVYKRQAKNNVHDLAKVHTTRFLVSQPFILLPRVSFGIVR